MDIRNYSMFSSLSHKCIAGIAKILNAAINHNFFAIIPTLFDLLLLLLQLS